MILRFHRVIIEPKNPIVTREDPMGLFDLFKKNPAPTPKGPKVTISADKHCTVIGQNGDVEVFIMPIEERIKKLKPIAEGLYAHEILILSYAETFHLSGNEYQGFWWWHYGIQDVSAILKSLQSRGFITEGGTDSAVKSCTTSELKEFLKSQGLKVGGKKDDLVARVLTEAEPSAVQAAFPNKTYVLTEKGRMVLDANMAIIEAHKDPEKRIWDVPENELNRSPKTGNERWGEMNAEYMGHVQSGDFGLARNTRFEMANFLASEGRYVDAIDTLCSVMAYDLAVTGNNFNPELFLKVGTSTLFPYESSVATIPPGVIKLVKKWQKKAELDDGQLQDLLLRGFTRYENPTPIALFTPEESLAIFNLESIENKAGLSSVYEKAEKRFFDKYPSAKK